MEHKCGQFMVSREGYPRGGGKTHIRMTKGHSNMYEFSFFWGALRPRAGYTVALYEHTTVALWCIGYAQQLLCVMDQQSARSRNRLAATTNRAIPSKYRINMALFAPKNFCLCGC